MIFFNGLYSSYTIASSGIKACATLAEQDTQTLRDHTTQANAAGSEWLAHLCYGAFLNDSKKPLK